MFRMSHDAVDSFSADFTAAGVIVAGEEYPLGYFAAEALEVSGQLTLDIGMSSFCGGRMRRPASPATRTAGRCGTR